MNAVSRPVVVKFGGNAMTDREALQGFSRTVLAAVDGGQPVVVVHGGGPQITAMLDRLGVESRFEGGFRVTSPAAMDVVRMVLTGIVQRELVSALNERGSRAVGLSGEDGRMLMARPLRVQVEGRTVDLGQAGEVVDVDPGPMLALLAAGYVPVVSSIGFGADGAAFNVNADTAAGAIASALHAESLVMLTDVPGLYRDWPDSDEVIETIAAGDLEALMPSLSEGMIPKMGGCLTAVRGGVDRAQVIDGAALAAALAGGLPGTTVVGDVR
jgi:acetylglutamate kinase